MPPAPFASGRLSLQTLPPRWAHFCLGVERFLRQIPNLHALSGSRLALSFSGGADSTALLLVMHCLAPRLECSLLAVHCDHAIRQDSVEEARHVQNFCQEMGIPSVLERIDVPTLATSLGVGLEDAGREARRDLLRRVLAQENCTFSLVGHHLNDLAEDQLMRALRGTGWPALGGMAAFLPDERLLRPLLLTPKKTLLAFLRDISIPWCEDASNQDTAFLRNRVRMGLLPTMLQENPNYLECAAELWRQANADMAHFQSLCARILDKLKVMDEGALFLPHDSLAQCDEAVRLRVYKACLERLGPGQPLAASLRALDRARQEKHSGAMVQFPGDKGVRIVSQGLLFLPYCKNT